MPLERCARLAVSFSEIFLTWHTTELRNSRNRFEEAVTDTPTSRDHPLVVDLAVKHDCSPVLTQASRVQITAPPLSVRSRGPGPLRSATIGGPAPSKASEPP